MCFFSGHWYFLLPCLMAIIVKQDSQARMIGTSNTTLKCSKYVVPTKRIFVWEFSPYSLETCDSKFESLLYFSVLFIFMFDFPFQIQFWIVTFHTLYSIYLKCGYPRGYQSLLVIYMFTQKALFMNFYKKAYKPSQPTKPSELDQNDNLSLNGKHQNGKADWYFFFLNSSIRYLPLEWPKLNLFNFINALSFILMLYLHSRQDNSGCRKSKIKMDSNSFSFANACIFLLTFYCT